MSNRYIDDQIISAEETRLDMLREVEGIDNGNATNITHWCIIDRRCD